MATAVVGGTSIPGDIEIHNGSIVAVGCHPLGPRGTAVAGFVDLQVNGFAGVDFATTDPAGYQAAGSGLAATGVTSYQPTFISLPVEEYGRALAVAAAAQNTTVTAAPRILGVHLEGPFLAASRSGAHNPAHTLQPDRTLADGLLAAGPVTYMTVAPESDGAIDLIEHLTQAGIVVACGHSDADATTANDAFDRGARAVTHIFNAMRPWKHRDPGLSGVALTRSDVVVTMILDGFHLAAETVEMIRRCASGRVALITDAIAATGLAGGDSRLGDRMVTVSNGRAELHDGTLAGSVLTMDRAVRTYVEMGASLPEAVRAATAVPAGLLGRPELGDLTPGTPADIVVLDDRLQVTRTLIGGEYVFSA